MFAFLMAVLTGCATAPVFDSISEVILQTQGPAGIQEDRLEGERLAQAVSCLVTTEEITEDQVKREAMITEILLLRVKDRRGDRMFEVTTTENFSGRGKFYRNACMYKILKTR